MDWERKRGEEKEQTGKREGKCGIFREKSSTFSLEFPAIRPASSDEAGRKVAPHGKATRGYQTWGVSTNSRKVGVFLLLALLFA